MSMETQGKDTDQQTQPDVFDTDFSLEKARNPKQTVARLCAYLMRQKRRLLAVLLCTIGSALFAILAPKICGIAINEIFNGIKAAATQGARFRMSWGTMGWILALLLGLYALESLADYLQQRTMASVAQTLTLDLRKEISAKLNRLPLRYFDRHSKGDILSRTVNDLERVANTLQDSLTQLLSSVIGIVGAFAMMMLISPTLTLIAAGTIALSMVIALLIASRTERSFATHQEALARLNGGIEEAFTGNTVIKAFNLEQQTIDNVEKVNEQLYQAGSKAMFQNYVISPIIRLVNQFGYMAIAVKGALSAINGSISIGDIQAFIQYVTQVSEPVAEVSYTMNTLQGAIASAERVFVLLDEEEEPADVSSPTIPADPKGHVEFEHVRFGYGEGTTLMRDISLDVKAGSTIAIVGPTGAGKTTLVNLLMRFYDIQGGRIAIDGFDIATMRRSDLRSLMGMVLQDTWLFGGTIRDNIAYGREHASDAEIRAAAQAARADHFIRTLPQGYETVIDGETTNLSQGQRQLLTIARAILADPTILILDEATSSVDTRTELEIQKAMDTMMKGRTSFIIAHRLSTIRDADRILVMNHGTIIEQGDHKELLARHGFYADLYNSQFETPAR